MCADLNVGSKKAYGSTAVSGAAPQNADQPQPLAQGARPEASDVPPELNGASTFDTSPANPNLLSPPQRVEPALSQGAPATEDPLTPPKDASPATLAALKPDADPAARRAAANQFTAPWSASGVFSSRDTEVDRNDAASALALFRAETLRSSKDPDTVAKLEEVLLQGIDEAANKKEPGSLDLARRLADTIPADASFSPETRALAAKKSATLAGGFSPDTKPSDLADIARRTTALAEEIGKDLPPGSPASGPLNDLRRSVAERAFAAARRPGVCAEDAAALRQAGETLGRNLPTDPATRAVVEKLASSEIKPEQLSREDAKTALAALRAYPPTLPARGDPKIEEGTQQGFARKSVQDALEKRVAELDAIYARSGWTDDSPIQPGTPERPDPAADQALIADVVESARSATPEGRPLDARSFEGISPLDTAKSLKAIVSFKAANPEIFGAAPPSDPAAKETRSRIESLDGSLKRHAAIQALTAQVDGLEHHFDKMLAERGIVGRFADGIKNNVGLEGGWLVDSRLGSDAVVSSVRDVARARNALNALRDFKGDDKAFDKAYGEAAKNLEGKLKGAAEHVQEFAKSQAAWVDGLTDVAAVTTAVGAAAFTGGASLVVGALVGATTKVGLKGLDAATGSGSYDGSVFGDLLKGGFAGGSGVLTGRLAQQLARSSASRLTGLLGEGLATRATSMALGEAGAGMLDGGAVSSFSTLVDGGSFSDAFKNGVRGTAFGGLLGPLVGGSTRLTASGWSRIANAVRAGSPLPDRVPASMAKDLAEAQLARAGIRPGELPGELAVRALPEGNPPFARLGRNGKLEVGLPVGKDGTISARDLAHEAEHLKQIAQARASGDPKLVRDLAEADRAAADVRRLQKELSLSTGSAERGRVEGELKQAMRRYEQNPVERQARAAGYEAEALAALKAGDPMKASTLHGIARRLRSGEAVPTAGDGVLPEDLQLYGTSGRPRPASGWASNLGFGSHADQLGKIEGALSGLPAKEAARMKQLIAEAAAEARRPDGKLKGLSAWIGEAAGQSANPSAFRASMKRLEDAVQEVRAGRSAALAVRAGEAEVQAQLQRMLQAPGTGFRSYVHPSTGKVIPEPGFSHGQPTNMGRKQAYASGRLSSEATYPDYYGTVAGQPVSMELKVPKLGETVQSFFSNLETKRELLSQQAGRQVHLPKGTRQELVIDLRQSGQSTQAALDDLSQALRSIDPRGQLKGSWDGGVRFITGTASSPVLTNPVPIP